MGPLYLALAVISGGLYPYSQKYSKKVNFHSQAALSYLSHIWALLGLPIAYSQPVIYALGLTILYAGRSWHERRSDLQVIVAIGGIYTLARFIGISYQMLQQLALAMIGLAVVYILISRWFKGREGRESRFDYRFANSLYNYTGQGLVFAGVVLVLPTINISYITLTLVAALVVSIWLAFTERVEWAYVALVLSLSAYISGYELTGINWNWFGLALLVPVIGYILISRWLRGRSGNDVSPSYALEIDLYNYVGQSLILAGVLLSLIFNNFSYITVTLAAALLVSIWLAFTERIEWGYAALLLGLGEFSSGFYLLEIPWHWYGLTLFLPALIILGVGLWLVEYHLPVIGLGIVSNEASPKEMLGLAFCTVAEALLLIGLPFSYQRDGLMLAHLLIITTLSLVFLRTSRMSVWLYLALPASLYAYSVGMYMTGIEQGYYGLALLPLVTIYLAGDFYLSYKAAWLYTVSREFDKWLLLLTAQGLALVGIYFSAERYLTLAIQLGAISLIYLVILTLSRIKLWLYPLIISAHLTYIATLAVLLSGLTLVNTGLALLPIGLVATFAATIFGVKTGHNLRYTVVQFTETQDILPALSSPNLLLYLIGVIDLALSLGLTIILPENWTGERSGKFVVE